MSSFITDINNQNSNGREYDTNVTSRCRKYNGFYPSFTPTISSLSKTTSKSGTYSLVYINGTNFLPSSLGTTYVIFGNISLPITFYSSFNISFVVPLNVTPGNYPVSVVNVYNDNFSPSINQSYAGVNNFSNSVIYNIT